VVQKGKEQDKDKEETKEVVPKNTRSFEDREYRYQVTMKRMMVELFPDPKSDSQEISHWPDVAARLGHFSVTGSVVPIIQLLHITKVVSESAEAVMWASALNQKDGTPPKNDFIKPEHVKDPELSLDQLKTYTLSPLLSQSALTHSAQTTILSPNDGKLLRPYLFSSQYGLNVNGGVAVAMKHLNPRSGKVVSKYEKEGIESVTSTSTKSSQSDSKEDDFTDTPNPIYLGIHNGSPFGDTEEDNARPIVEISLKLSLFDLVSDVMHVIAKTEQNK